MRNYKRNIRASAMSFALVAILVIGILIAIFAGRSSRLLELTGIKSTSSKLQVQADANYDLVMTATLQAYAWAIMTRSGDANPTPAPYLEAAYGGVAGLQALRNEIVGTCWGRTPCSAPPGEHFEGKVFPEARAGERGFRYVLTPQQNANFEGSAADFPKRFFLVVYQADPAGSGTELKVSGSFTIGPTNLSSFSTMAYAMSPSPVVMSDGDHTMAGYFFSLTNPATGEPYVIPETDCRLEVEQSPSLPPAFDNFTIYFYPRPGGSLSAQMIASNVDNFCFGAFQRHRWGYSWGGEMDASGIKAIDNLLVTSAPQSSLETSMRARYSDALSRMPGPDLSGGLAPPPMFNPAGQLDGGYYRWSPIERKRHKPQAPPAPRNESPKSFLMGSLGVVRLPSQYLLLVSAEMSGVEELGSTPQSSVQGFEPMGSYSGIHYYSGEGASAYTSVPQAVASHLYLGRCHGGSGISCDIKYTVDYIVNGQRQTVEVFEGRTDEARLRDEFNNEFASSAPSLSILPLHSDQTVLEMGKANITVFTNGSATVYAPIVNTSDSFNPPRDPSNPHLGGQLLIVNTGNGPGVTIPPSYKSMPYRDGAGNLIQPSLGAIRSGGAYPPRITDPTIRMDAGVVALGQSGGGGARPIALHPSMLIGGQPGTNPLLGSCEFNGVLWAREKNDQLRTLTPTLNNTAAGCQRINSQYVPKWMSNPALNIESTEILGLSEGGRSYEIIESTLDSRIAAARDELGL